MAASTDMSALYPIAEHFLGHPPDVASVEGRHEFYHVLARYFLLLAGDFDPELTVQQAARLVGRSDECVRLWCVRRKLGRFSTQWRRYRIRHSELVRFWIANFGAATLPAGLRNR